MKTHYILFVFILKMVSEECSSQTALPVDTSFNYKTTKLADVKPLSAYFNVDSLIKTKEFSNRKENELIFYKNMFNSCIANKIIISRNGRKCIYTIAASSREFIEGWVNPELNVGDQEIVKSPVLSEDGNHLAYIIKSRSDKSYMVVYDGKVRKKYYSPNIVYSPIFNNDGTKLIYIVYNAGQAQAHVVQMDSTKETQSEQYKNINELKFCNNGKTITYNATVSSNEEMNQKFIIADEKKISKNYEGFRFTMSNINNIVAYSVSKNPKYYNYSLMVNGKELGLGDAHYGDLLLNNDGSKLAFVKIEKAIYEEKYSENDRPVMGSSENPRSYIGMVELNNNNKITWSRAFRFVEVLLFNSKNEIAGVVQTIENEEHTYTMMWENNEAIYNYEPVGRGTSSISSLSNYVFSSDGKYLAYTASENGIVVWDKKNEKWFDLGEDYFIGPLFFSPDNKHIAYGVGRGGGGKGAMWRETKEIWWIVKDIE